jgi:predicted nuclease with TOPRIM domain
MELGEDFASLAITLNKRELKPEIPELKNLQEQVNHLQEQLQRLLKENYELKKQLIENIPVNINTENVDIKDYLKLGLVTKLQIDSNLNRIDTI